MKNIGTKILSVILVILAVFIFVKGRYKPIEDVILLDQSFVSHINIEMYEPYEELNGSYVNENDIAEIT